MDNLKISSEKLEEMILSASTLNLSFFMKIKQYLDTSSDRDKKYFSDPKNQIVFNIYSKYFDKYKKQPTKATMLTLLERISDANKYEEEIKIYLLSIAERMFTTSSSDLNLDFIEEETINFIKENLVYEAIAKSQIDIDNKNYGAIVDRMQRAVSVNFDKDLGISIKDTEEILKRLNKVNTQKIISTGFPNLDNFLEGGLYPKELTVLAGIPGTGKTMIMGAIGINAFLAGHNVLVYTFETSTERLSMRYYNNLLNKTKGEILYDEEGFKQSADKLFQSSTGDMIIKEYNSNTTSSNNLLAHIYDLQMYWNWKPDLIIADYLLIMNTNDISMSSENSYKYYKTISEELRNVGKILEIPILSAMQINREGMSENGGSKSLLTGKDISESRGVLDTSDNFIPIAQTAKDKQKLLIYLLGEKMRNNKTGWRIQYQVDYDHMKITEGAIVN